MNYSSTYEPVGSELIKISHILGSQNDKFVVVVDILKALSLLRGDMLHKTSST